MDSVTRGHSPCPLQIEFQLLQKVHHMLNWYSAGFELPFEALREFGAQEAKAIHSKTGESPGVMGLQGGLGSF